MADKNDSSTQSSSLALTAVLAWVLPGLGHFFIGERARGVILFVVTTVTFWGGVAMGGVRSTVNVKDNGAWIAAQFCMGPQALGALYFSQKIQSQPDEQSYRAIWPASNISVVYAGVAGMLNILIMIDALARCEATTSTAARSPPRRSESQS